MRLERGMGAVPQGHGGAPTLTDKAGTLRFVIGNPTQHGTSPSRSPRACTFETAASPQAHRQGNRGLGWDPVGR